MKILIVSATSEEIMPLLTLIHPGQKQMNVYDQAYYRGLELTCLVTGPGIFATAYSLGKHLANTRYDLVLNLGIAGSFQKNIRIGQVVRISKDEFADFGAEDGEQFLSQFDLGFIKEDDFPYEGKELLNPIYIKNTILEKIPTAKGITVNTAHGSEESIRSILKRTNAETESMEGAAFLYVCHLENIPCLQIRAVSNYIERRNKNAWNVPLAIKNLNATAIQILDSFNA